MIKVGILGADSLQAGELLRLLVAHPEIDIQTLHAPALIGCSPSSCHHGFIGEKLVNFSDKISPDSLDVIFITEDSQEASEIIKRRNEWDNLKIVIFSQVSLDPGDDLQLDYGLSEINRKALVRGSRHALLPSPVASLALVALYPLALYLLLGADLKIEVGAPEDIISSFNPGKVADEIALQLRKAQNSFDHKIDISIEPNTSERVMRVKCTFPCSLPLEEIEKIYDNIYDDHNFAFTAVSELEGREVEGTHKAVVSIFKPYSDILVVETIADGRLRGGAGDAIHVMNLFFGLHEMIGLKLKPSRYGEKEISTSKPASWFA